MPRLREMLARAEESAGGFADVEPGAYKLVVTKVEPHESQEYVRIYWDVAEGPRRGAYARSQYPPSDVASWKASAHGMLKHKLHVLAECNPQRLHALTGSDGAFESLEEFERDDWQALVGCRFGAVVRRRLYTAGPNSKAPGADRTAVEVARWLHPREYADADWPESLLADNDQRDQGAARQAQARQEPVQVPQSFSAAPDLYDEDVPF